MAIIVPTNIIEKGESWLTIWNVNYLGFANLGFSLTILPIFIYLFCKGKKHNNDFVTTQSACYIMVAYFWLCQGILQVTFFYV